MSSIDAAPSSVAAASSGMDVASRQDIDKLHGGAIGLTGVLLLTVTGAAPITAMLGNVPIVVGNGTGIGAPAAFLFATVVLTIFSVGYAAMARKVSAVGGFYSFISHGLGRELGMAMALGSIVAYSVFEASLAGGFAYFAAAKLSTWGITIAWPYLALVMLAGVTALCYFDVKLSAAILGVALVGEVVSLAIFDIGVFSHAGSGAHIDPAALNPFAAFKGFDAPSPTMTAGVASIGLFFAFWSWVGFEMAPNYAEESKNPKKIIPMSLYISVISLGLFYIVTSWAALSAYPSVAEAITAGQTDASNFFLKPASIFVGDWLNDVMSYLILTSSFACGMAFHNTAARYLYSLGRERILPAAVGKTHPKHKAPYVASFVQTAIAAVVVLVFAAALGKDDPNQAFAGLYGLMALFGTTLILVAQAVVSLAIIAYFRREHPEDHHWFETLVAPVVAFLAQVAVIAMLVANLDFLSAGYAFAKWIPGLVLAILAIGVVGAVALKRTNRAKYDSIGRMIYEGVPE
ncbi:APC family permease [Chelatococcus sambhunathii]|uniref:APC family permease n=1 Tax=Chelatococcus sambhunathii TaxID=363953 RepID=A0ABU1DD59_9HYPH|nr:APC family permease [Chelatococcus sambhunathii]MDR4306053.1 APC family permease [Chelatococcus sambhunathii]